MRATWGVRGLRRGLPLLLALLVGAGIAIPVLQSAAPADSLLGGLLGPLSGDVLPGLASATSLGPAEPGKRLDIDVALAHPNPAGETALYQAIYDPASPSYHQFLTPAAFAARFGVAPATTQAAVAWLQAGGLQILQVATAGDLVAASGSVAQVAALLHTSFADYTA
ncbi:MAG: protease pro-enzyme activation domain-containing protein, partial [Actinomycetota bacterium]